MTIKGGSFWWRDEVHPCGWTDTDVRIGLSGPGFRGEKVHAEAPRYSIEFKSQVAEEAGETLHGLAKRHDISRNLVRIWVAKYEAEEARIAALERLVGKLALENEFLKGASRDAVRPRSESTFVIAPAQ